jgi:hypothetical protein
MNTVTSLSMTVLLGSTCMHQHLEMCWLGDGHRHADCATVTVTAIAAGGCPPDSTIETPSFTVNGHDNCNALQGVPCMTHPLV